MPLALGLFLSLGNSLSQAQESGTTNFIPRLLSGNNAYVGINTFGTVTGGVAGGQFGSNPFNYLATDSRVFIGSTTALNPSGLPLISAVVQDGAGGFNFPTAITGLGQLNHTGYLAFGSNFLAEQFTTGGTYAGEDDANNWFAAPSASFPPDFSSGNLVTAVYPIGRQVMCGGNFNCFFALGAGQNSGSSSQWLVGFYTWPAAIKNYGILIDSNTTQGPQYSAFLKNLGTGSDINVILQTTGSFTATNQTIGQIDASGNRWFSLYQDGSLFIGHNTGSQTTPSHITFSDEYQVAPGNKIQLYSGYTLGISAGSLDYNSVGHHMFYIGGVTATDITSNALLASVNLDAGKGTPTFGACGASPSFPVTSNDSRGVITMGTGTTTCTVNFGVAYPTQAVCVGSQVSGASAAMSIGFNPSSFTITGVAGDNYSYVCLGH